MSLTWGGGRHRNPAVVAAGPRAGTGAGRGQRPAVPHKVNKTNAFPRLESGPSAVVQVERGNPPERQPILENWIENRARAASTDGRARW